MQLTVLIDNNTLIDQYLHGEPGVSYFLHHRGRNILFDTGYSDILLSNAKKLGIDLTQLDNIVLSHGHNDHTRGLEALIRLHAEQPGGKTPTLIAHPDAFAHKALQDGEAIGATLPLSTLRQHFTVNLSRTPLWLDDDLVFLGEIPRQNTFEAQEPVGLSEQDGTLSPDYVLDDSALVWHSPQGLVLITGCSHAGICNIIEYAKTVCHETRIVDIIGGFHLMNPAETVLQATSQYLSSQQIKTAHACHCTDLHSKIHLAQAVNLQEVGVGLRLDFNTALNTPS